MDDRPGICRGRELARQGFIPGAMQDESAPQGAEQGAVFLGIPAPEATEADFGVRLRPHESRIPAIHA